MLQDLEFGHLDNQYHKKLPQSEDIVLCMRKADILICRDCEDHLTLPTWEQVHAVCRPWHRWSSEMRTQFVFSLQGKDYYLWMGEAGGSTVSPTSLPPHCVRWSARKCALRQ